MTENRKKTGMTSAQIGILIGLGAVVILLFAAMAWLLLGGTIRMPSFSRAPKNTSTPYMTPTMIVLPTITPTATLTPIPYEQLIPADWKQFKTALVEIWLPSSFKTADKQADEELSLLGTTSKNSLYKVGATVSFEPLNDHASYDHCTDDEAHSFAALGAHYKGDHRNKDDRRVHQVYGAFDDDGGQYLHEGHARFAAEQKGASQFSQTERQEVVEDVAFAHRPEGVAVGWFVAHQCAPDLRTHGNPHEAEKKRACQQSIICIAQCLGCLPQIDKIQNRGDQADADKNTRQPAFPIFHVCSL